MHLFKNFEYKLCKVYNDIVIVFDILRFFYITFLTKLFKFLIFKIII